MSDILKNETAETILPQFQSLGTGQRIEVLKTLAAQCRKEELLLLLGTVRKTAVQVCKTLRILRISSFWYETRRDNASASALKGL
jgi:hypothetical protein